MMAAPLLPQLERAKNALEDAQIALCGAVTAHAEAKRGLELQAEHTALAEAEDTLTEARCALEVARLEWELARYKIRALETPLASAA